MAAVNTLRDNEEGRPGKERPSAQHALNRRRPAAGRGEAHGDVHGDALGQHEDGGEQRPQARGPRSHHEGQREYRQGEEESPQHPAGDGARGHGAGGVRRESATPAPAAMTSATTSSTRPANGGTMLSHAGVPSIVAGGSGV